MEKSNSPEQNEIKNSLLKLHDQNLKDGERIDISKILEDYQNKFNVPKVIIMKWLGLNQQKSLFNKNKLTPNISQSGISQESEYTISECSPNWKKVEINCNFSSYQFGVGFKSEEQDGRLIINIDQS